MIKKPFWTIKNKAARPVPKTKDYVCHEQRKVPLQRVAMWKTHIVDELMIAMNGKQPVDSGKENTQCETC